MRKPVFLVIFFLIGIGKLSFAQEFEFKYQPTNRYQIKTEIVEDVYQNGEYSHTSRVLLMEWLNIIRRYKDQYTIVGEYSLNENTSSLGVAYQQKYEYKDLIYKMSNRGKFSNDKKNFMPVKRDYPMFVEGIKRGSLWFTPTYEVHDFRGELYGINHPYQIPSAATWEFTGMVEKEGKSYSRLISRISILYEPNPVPALYKRYPVVISGFSQGEILWDSQLGLVHSASENFDISFELNDGQIFRYKGKSLSSAEKMEPIDPARLDELKKMIGNLGKVNKGNGFIRITLDSINFGPEEYTLTEIEKEKLDAVCKEVAGFRGRFVKIEGYTHEAGTEEGRATLSLQRAEVVRNYLLSKDAVDPDMVTAVGKGSSDLIDTTGSDEGKKKNRRVEIYIMVGND